MKSGLALIVLLAIFLLAILLPLPLIVILVRSTNTTVDHELKTSRSSTPNILTPYQMPKPDPDGWITLYRGNSSQKIEPIEPPLSPNWLTPLAPAYAA